MRVLFAQQQPCIRTFKYAVALRAAQPGLQLGFAARGKTLTEFYGTGDELFDRWWRLDEPAADLAAAVREFAPDVIHCHNLPDEMTVLAKQVTDGDVPVVHDIHDMASLRTTPYEDGFDDPADPLELERQAIAVADAVVVVSDEMLAQVAKRYGRPERVVTFANYALARDLPIDLPPPDRPRNGALHLVYQGTLSVGGGHYDLRDTFRTIAGDGLRLDVHPARVVPEYAQLARELPAMCLHAPVDPVTLLATLPRYDLGWAGFNATHNTAHLDTVLPNKVFEYLGCGLPVLTQGHRALARFLADEGVGVSLTTLDDLGGQLDALDLPALRRRTHEARRRFTVEGAIGRIVDCYEEVLG